MSNGFHVHQHKKVSFFLRSASKNGKQKHIPSTNSNNNNKNISKKVSSSSSPSPSSGYRINKCLTNLSRRAADQAIVEGRVTVNGKVATPGQMVNAGSIVKLDNQVQHFKTLMKAKLVVLDESELEDRNFIYLKYWKPIGVTCTSDPNDSSNLISAGRFDLFPQRLFSVGRLDKDSTGLILVTSDGRVNNALLSPSVSKEKVYEVRLNKSPSDADIAKLRDGVVITTVSQKDSGAKSVTAKTLPCKVTRNIRDSNT